MFGLPTFGMERDCDYRGLCENVDLAFGWSLLNEVPSIGLGLLALGWAASSIVSLEKNEAAVLVSFFDSPKGTFNKAGANFKAPWPFTKVRSRVSLKTDMQSTTLKDVKTQNVPIPEIPVHIQYKVVDAEKYVYESDSPLEIMVEKVSRAVKSKIKPMSLDDIIGDLTDMSDDVKTEINAEMLEHFGIEILDVIVDEPQLPEAYEAAFIRKEAASLTKDAAEIEGQAEGQRITETMKAIIAGMAAVSTDTTLQGAFANSGMSAIDFLQLAQQHVVASDATKNGGIVVSQGGGNIDGGAFARGVAVGEQRANDKGNGEPKFETKRDQPKPPTQG